MEKSVAFSFHVNTKKILFILLLFLCFLGLYTYNVRTNSLDDVATNTGLELSGGIFKTVDSFTSSVRSSWFKYIDNTNAREENDLLKEELAQLKRDLDKANEERAELLRLRKFFALEVPEDWTALATRVIAGKLGAYASLESIVIDKGYLSGAKVGSPLMTEQYLVGRVLKASPTKAMVLLINDFGSKVAVVSEQTRLHGVLSGSGHGQPLEVHFINQDSSLLEGETLYTSGLDDAFPKGIPVAKVVGSQSLALESFKIYYAESLANFSRLEELLVLTPPAGWIAIEKSEVYTPKEDMEKYILLPEIEEENMGINAEGNAVNSQENQINANAQ